MPIARVSAVVIALSLLVAACGSDDSSAANEQNTAGGGLPAGITRVACYEMTENACHMHGEDSASGIASRQADCTSDNGTSSDHCPSAGLLGCCVIAGLGDCFYDAAGAMSGQNACSVAGGTWATSAPLAAACKPWCQNDTKVSLEFARIHPASAVHMGLRMQSAWPLLLLSLTACVTEPPPPPAVDHGARWSEPVPFARYGSCAPVCNHPRTDHDPRELRDVRPSADELVRKGDRSVMNLPNGALARGHRGRAPDVSCVNTECK